VTSAGHRPSSKTQNGSARIPEDIALILCRDVGEVHDRISALPERPPARLRAWDYAIKPTDLANIRQRRSWSAITLTIINADRWPDDLTVRSFGPDGLKCGTERVKGGDGGALLEPVSHQRASDHHHDPSGNSDRD